MPEIRTEVFCVMVATKVAKLFLERRLGVMVKHLLLVEPNEHGRSHTLCVLSLDLSCDTWVVHWAKNQQEWQYEMDWMLSNGQAPDIVVTSLDPQENLNLISVTRKKVSSPVPIIVWWSKHPEKELPQMREACLHAGADVVLRKYVSDNLFRKLFDELTASSVS